MDNIKEKKTPQPEKIELHVRISNKAMEQLRTYQKENEYSSLGTALEKLILHECKKIEREEKSKTEQDDFLKKATASIRYIDKNTQILLWLITTISDSIGLENLSDLENSPSYQKAKKASGAAIQKNKNLKSDKRKKGQADSHPDILDEQDFEDEIIISYID